MHIPTIPQAETLLDEAGTLNPGPWTRHSRNVAQAARRIAEHLPGVDPDAAYVLGCLHDIGRREGVTAARHILDGYRFLAALGYEDAARICITHSYPFQHIDAIAGPQDWDAAGRAFVADYLESIEYTPYDRLIQLCDCLADAEGFCLIEKRLVNVTLRYGMNDYTIPKWQAFFAIQRDFEARMGRSVYSVLPGVVENTFGD
jgi:hypothetical protein